MAGSFFTTGGTVHSDSPGYVERAADRELYEALVNREFCYVLDSRQKGKSSLVSRSLSRLDQAGIATATIDLQRFGTNLNAERWYAGMLNAVAEGVRSCTKQDYTGALFDYWATNQTFGPLERWMGAIQKVLLPLMGDRQLVIFIDEIDFVRSLPFDTDEFFSGIRECFNRRSENPTLSRLTFCLLGVATPSDLIKDVRITPFNIGRRIELTDFSLQESLILADGLVGSGRTKVAAERLVRKVHYWTNGHPYLTQKLCAAVSVDDQVLRPSDVDHLVKRTFFDRKAREEEPNLRDVSRRVLESPIEGLTLEESRARILDLFRRIRENRHVRDDESDHVAAILKLAGLASVLGGYLLVRNRVYFRVFDRSWIEAGMPDAELTRQRIAVRRATLRTAVIAGSVVLGMASLVAYSADQANLARVAAFNTGVANKNMRAALQVAKSEQLRAQSAAARERSEKSQVEASLRHVQSAESAEKKATELALAQKKIAISQSLLAKANEVRAKGESRMAREAVYDLSMSRIQTAFENKNLELATQILRTTEQSEFRGFEWGFWNRLLLHPQIRAFWRSDQGSREDVVWSPDGSWLVYSGFAYRSIDGLPILGKGMNGWIPNGKPAKLVVMASAIVSGHVRILATNPSSSSVLQVYDLPGKSPIATMPTSGDDVYGARFSPDGRKVVCWAIRGGNTPARRELAFVWDAQSGTLISTIDNHSLGRIDTAFFTTNGRQLVTVAQRGISVWMANTGWLVSQHASVVGFPGTGMTWDQSRTALSQDGTKLMTTFGTRLEIWDAKSGHTLESLRSDGPENYSCATFSRDGKWVIAGTYRGRTDIWNLETGKMTVKLDGPTESIKYVCFSPDGAHVLTVDDDQFARISDAKTGRLLTSIRAFPCNWGDYVGFSPDGSRFIACDMLFDASVRSVKRSLVLGQAGAVRTGELPSLGKEFSAAKILGDGSRMIVTGPAAAPTLYDIRSGAYLGTIQVGHDLGFEEPTYSEDGGKMMVFSASPNGYSQVWDITRRKKLLDVSDQDGIISRAFFSPDGSRLAVAFRQSRGEPDNILKVWNVQDRTLDWSGRFPLPISTVAFSPDGKQFLCCNGWSAFNFQSARPKTLRKHSLTLRNSSTGKVLAERTTDRQTAVSAKFSPDGSKIALLLAPDKNLDQFYTNVQTAETNNTSTSTWHICGAQFLKAEGLRDGAQPINVLFEMSRTNNGPSHIVDPSFSRDGTKVLVGSTVWCPGKQSAVMLATHSDAIHSACLSPDGSRVVTSSLAGDTSVDVMPPGFSTIWNAETGDPILIFRDAGVASWFFGSEVRAVCAPFESAKLDPLVLTFGRSSTPNQNRSTSLSKRKPTLRSWKH